MLRGQSLQEGSPPGVCLRSVPGGQWASPAPSEQEIGRARTASKLSSSKEVRP